MAAAKLLRSEADLQQLPPLPEAEPGRRHAAAQVCAKWQQTTSALAHVAHFLLIPPAGASPAGGATVASIFTSLAGAAPAVAKFWSVAATADSSLAAVVRGSSSSDRAQSVVCLGKFTFATAQACCRLSRLLHAGAVTLSASRQQEAADAALAAAQALVLLVP